MDLQLSGKRALITGSTSGIGEAIARTLAQEGAAVVVSGRKEREAERVSAAIKAAGGKSGIALGDLSSDEGARLVAEHAIAAFGGIDILINNAGSFPDRAWLEASPSDWLDLYNQNLVSMVRMIHFIVPQMRKLGWGRIIQLSSGVAASPSPSMAAYSSTKAASVNITGGLAKFLGGSGITVNVVSPGMILTPGLRRMFAGIAQREHWPDQDAEIEKRILEDYLPNPAGRVGRVEDVADLVTFLSSPRAGYINGANIRVDGGTIDTMN